MTPVRITRSKVIGLALNLKEDCDCCVYCWNSTINEKFHEDRVGSTVVDTNFDELIEQLDNGRIPKPPPEEKCQFYVNSGRDLLLGAKTEFFHPDAKDTAMKVLQLLEVYPEVSARTRVLTKQDILDVVPRFPTDLWVGASITTLSPKVSKLIQPRAAKPERLIEMLQDANELGFPTWVVVEPFFKFMDLWKLVDELQFVKEMWVGRLNGGRNIPVITNPLLAKLADELVTEEQKGNLKFDIRAAGIGRKGKVKTVGDYAEDDSEIVKQFKEVQKYLKGAVVQKDWIQEDGTVLYDQSTPFVYNLYPKKEVKRLLEKADQISTC